MIGRALRTLLTPPAAVPLPQPAGETVAALTARLDAAAQARLGRSLALLHVPAGGCNGCELELRALRGVVYDLARLGLHFVGSPRQADVLLVTGPLTRNMREALVLALEAAAEPRWVVAIGDCAVDGGVFRGSYAVLGGAADAVPVDLLVRGCPPSPLQVLAGLVTLGRGAWGGVTLTTGKARAARGRGPRAVLLRRRPCRGRRGRPRAGGSASLGTRGRAGRAPERAPGRA